ncbi:MAG: hypothetical protein AVDCRST_MAG93-4539, partial [uncultured Chloroflexia bacterium]
ERAPSNCNRLRARPVPRCLRAD